MTTKQSDAVRTPSPTKIDIIRELSLAHSSVDQALHRIRRLSRAFPERQALMIASSRLEEVKSLLLCMTSEQSEAAPSSIEGDD